jgi:hypothetical protein
MPPQLDTLIICDDVREEMGNKATLVGIYGKHLFFPKNAKFPAGMRQLCLFLRCTGAKGGETVRLRVSRDAQTVFESPESSPVKAPDYPNEYSSISLYLIPFAVESVGDLKFSLYWGNENKPFREEIMQVRLAD